MAKCRRCPAVLPGRRQLCDACKAERPGTADVVKSRKGPAPTKKASATKAAEDPKPDHPPGLHRRGQKLWQDLGCEVGTLAGTLAHEICRTADRLDEIDRIISGKGILNLMQFRLEDVDFDSDGDQHLTVKVQFQSVLTEARGQQTTFKEMLKQFAALQQLKPATPRGGSAPQEQAGPATPPATGLDQLSQRRAQREQTATAT